MAAKLIDKAVNFIITYNVLRICCLSVSRLRLFSFTTIILMGTPDPIPMSFANLDNSAILQVNGVMRFVHSVAGDS